MWVIRAGIDGGQHLCVVQMTVNAHSICADLDRGSTFFCHEVLLVFPRETLTSAHTTE